MKYFFPFIMNFRRVLLRPLIILLVLIFLNACKDEEKKGTGILASFKPKDSTLCKINEGDISAFSTKYHLKDSLPAKLDVFYRQRSYLGAWTNNNGVNEYAGNFV